MRLYCLSSGAQIREARTRIEELDTEKGHLQKRLDKLRKERISAMASV